ncbi:MAG: glycosyltransferase [Akkermansiaceae bacterium]
MSQHSDSTATVAIVSVIIPVYNDHLALDNCLASIPSRADIEVIVADASEDSQTLDLAKKRDAVYISCSKGRARQMNAAAGIAKGTTLLFLHADAHLPAAAYLSLIDSIKNGVRLGCFRREFITENRLLTLTSSLAGWRAKKLFWVYGDQGIFISRTLFNQLGGYQLMEAFEDLDLAVRAKQLSDWEILDGPLRTSARRFGTSPLLRVLKDAALTTRWLLGLR